MCAGRDRRLRERWSRDRLGGGWGGVGWDGVVVVVVVRLGGQAVCDVGCKVFVSLCKRFKM